MDIQNRELAVKSVRFRRPNITINRIGTRSRHGEGQLLAIKLLPRHTKQGRLVYLVRCLCTSCLKHHGKQCGREFQLDASHFHQNNSCLHCARSLAASRQAKAGKTSRRYVSTLQIDEMLRRIYELGAGRIVDRKGVPTMTAYAAKLGWPYRALADRARELGVQRSLKSPKYSSEEIAIIERLAPVRSANYISRILKSRGYNRTACAVEAQLTRWQLLCESDAAYTGAALSRALGHADGKLVRKWVAQGLLRAVMPDGGAVVDGAIVKIKRAEVKRFLRQHYNLVDLRKVESEWLFDVVFDGRIGESTERVLRVTGKARATNAYMKDEVSMAGDSRKRRSAA